MSTYTQNFKNLGRDDAATAGGKGASLGEMTQAGIPVPPGFVVLTNAFEQFLEETNLKADIESVLDHVKHEEVSSVERASEEIQAMILGQDIPKDIAREVLRESKKLKSPFVAVRSSATAEDSSAAAWAGQLESYLNTTQKTLLENVKKCWASLFTPRAIFYRFEKKMHGQNISVAVVVQKMVVSETSGIAFSVHPVTQDRNQMIIEAGFGLGEAIVSGQITPDSYVLEKQPRKIIDTHVATQERGLFRAKNGGNEWKPIPKTTGGSQVLPRRQINQLGELLLRIEKHYGFPVDVEWAREKGKFYVVQSRPITTLQGSDSVSTHATGFQPEFQRESSISLFQIWLMGHVRAYEVLGLDKNLSEQVYGKFENGIVQGFTPPDNIRRLKKAIRNLGAARISSGLNEYEQNFRRMKQHPELAWDKEFVSGLVSGFVISYLAGDMPGQKFQSRAVMIRKKTERLFPFLSSALIQRAKIKKYAGRYSYDELASRELVSKQTLQARTTSIITLENISDRQSNTTGSGQKQKFIKAYTRNFSIIMQEAWFAANKDGLIERLGLTEYPFTPPYAYFMREGAEEVWENTAATGWLVDQLVAKVKRDKKFFPTIYRRYFEQLAEMEKWWKKDIRSLAELKELVKKIYAGVADFVVIYALMHEPRVPAAVRRRAKNMRRTDVYFAECNAAIMRALNHLYPKLRHLVCYITQAELGKAINARELTKRDAGFAFIPGSVRKAMNFEDFIAKFPEFEFVVERAETGIGTLTGQSAYRGNVSGRVRIVKRLDQAAQVQTGEIIVSPMTTPDFISAMKKAAAFVTDEGGITCHAAIVARELKKPCVIGTKFATQIFQDGDLVEVDANKGMVRKISASSTRHVQPYIPFSDPNNIDVMIRTLGVFPEEDVLDVTLFDWPGQPYKNLPGWVKYVSTQRQNPLEVYIYWDRKVEDVFLEPIQTRLRQDPKYFPWLVQQFQLWFKSFDELTQNIFSRGSEYFSELSNPQLISWFKRFSRVSKFALAGYYIVYDIMHALTYMVERDVDVVFSQLDAATRQRLFQDISTTGITSIVRDERIAYLQRLQRYQKAIHPAAREKIVWQQWYAFEGNAFHHRTSQPLTLDGYRRRFERDESQNASRELRAIRAEQARNQLRAKKMIRRLKQHPLLSKKVPQLRTMMRFRNNESLYLDTFYAHADPLLNALAKRLNIQPEDIWLLARKEIIGGLEGRVRAQPIITARKQRGFTIKQQGHQVRVTTGVEAEDVHQIPSVSKETLGGTIGFPGHVRGHVCIIRDPETEASRLKPGDVLVTSMTTPEYVPLMKKASAVVTNEGGLLCHAAIVARELKKPCVIGTRVATQVLKDGDLVEVDADKGIVRKIEPTSSSPTTRENTYEDVHHKHHPDDYIRMFAGTPFAFLLSDIFLGHYKNLGVLSMQDEKNWMSFLPKKTHQRTLIEGKRLYTSPAQVRAFKQAFIRYITSSTKYYASVLNQERLTSKQVKKFLQLVSHHFLHYSKTEFFYTDLLAQGNMALSVQEFDQLKLRGRAHLNRLIFEESGYVRRLIQKISRQTSVPTTRLLDYSIQELIDLIEHGRRVPADDLKRRNTFFSSAEVTLHGHHARPLLDKFLTPYRTSANIIHGTVANPGYAKGRVRVLMPDFKNFDAVAAVVKKMRKGELLVAETTSPEIIQACKKAAAIVTNQGGMLSHAAIISRELDIPCIIGTDKNVVVSLKTGDLVEVDANKGIVRKL